MPSRSFSPDVSTWSRERFALLLAVLVLAGSGMAASGARGHATLRQAHYRNLAQWHSKSPVPYLTPVAATSRLFGATMAGEAPLILVRADSVAEVAALCALAETRDRASDGIAWLALSPEVEPCVADARRRVVAISGAPADSLRAAIEDARWLVLDGSSRVVYSRRTVPTIEEVRGLASFLAVGSTHAFSPLTTSEPGA
jgi:hypothetical protein